MVSSSILHRSVSEYDGLIMVHWIKLFNFRIITCWTVSKSQTCRHASTHLFEPKCIGRDLAGRWEMAWQVNVGPYVYLNGVDNCRCRERHKDFKLDQIQAFCWMLHRCMHVWSSPTTVIEYLLIISTSVSFAKHTYSPASAAVTGDITRYKPSFLSVHESDDWAFISLPVF